MKFSRTHFNSMKLNSLFLLALLCAVLVGTVYGNTAHADQTCKTDTTLAIKDGRAQVQLAIDERTRRYGLMFRAKLGKDCGMLFIFKHSRTRVFTMRNVVIPLDIAFIDSEGRIAEIFTMEPGVDRYPSKVAAQYALEMNEGWFAENSITVGDIITVAHDDATRDATQGDASPSNAPLLSIVPQEGGKESR